MSPNPQLASKVQAALTDNQSLQASLAFPVRGNSSSLLIPCSPFLPVPSQHPTNPPTHPQLASKVQAALTDNQSLQASLASAKSRQQQQVAAAEAMRAQLRAAEATLGEREEVLRRAQAESAQEKTTYAARLEGVKHPPTHAHLFLLPHVPLPFFLTHPPTHPPMHIFSYSLTSLFPSSHFFPISLRASLSLPPLSRLFCFLRRLKSLPYFSTCFLSLSLTSLVLLRSMQKERDDAQAAVVVVEGRLAALEATLRPLPLFFSFLSPSILAPCARERDEAQAAVVVVEARLAALEAKLQQAAQTRTEIFKNNAELKARLESVLQQNRDLATQAARMEESGRQVSAVFEQREGALVQQIRNREAELAAQKKRAAAELAGVESRLEGELRKAEEEKQKYMQACDWLEKQLASLKAENETTIADLRSSLAFAEQRAKEEGAKVVQLRAELDKQTKDADRHKAALKKKVAELEGKLGSSQSQLSIAEKALATATAAANRVKTAGLAGLDMVSKGAEEQWARKHVTESLLKPALAAADAAAAAKTSSGAGSDKSGKKRVSKEALQSYARAIQHAYIDDSIPVKEQQAGMQLLVQELVAMGGEEEWARSFVHDSMAAATPASPRK
ncbi:unnamed protein product [Closterium sp. NIES-65]|nr:unnamed protein product [Closterium sp. NIES-65]